jgi:hypothetical protein
MDVKIFGSDNNVAEVIGNRLSVQALVRAAMVQASWEGNSYVFFSESISLTSTGADSGILYVKNEANNHLHVSQIVFSVNGQQVLFKTVKNPTAGTLITSGTERVAVNMRFDSGKTFDGTVLKGANGYTVTDGAVICQGYTNSRLCEQDQAYILTKNDSLAIIANPAVACSVCVAITGYMHDADAE